MDTYWPEFKKRVNHPLCGCVGDDAKEPAAQVVVERVGDSRQYVDVLCAGVEPATGVVEARPKERGDFV